MLWDDKISFAGLYEIVDEWYKDTIIGDPPIDAQFALDLLYKTLIDDKYHYPYITTMPDDTEQTNSIMLDELLRKYSRKYRAYVKKRKKGR